MASEDSGLRVFMPLLAFFTIAYVIAWSILGLFHMLAPSAGVANGVALLDIAESLSFEEHGAVAPWQPWVLYLFTRVADFSFSIAGVILIAVTLGRGGFRTLGARLVRWRFHWGWYLVAVLPLGLYILAASLADTGEPGEAAGLQVNGATLYRALFSLEAGLLVSLFLRGAFGEELGLRGFALPLLQRRYSPLIASLILGVGWWGWHLPVLVPRGVPTVVLLGIIMLLLTCLFTLLFNGSGGSLVGCLIFHALQNWEEGFETFLPGLVGSDWESVSSIGLGIAGLVAFVVLCYQRRRSAGRVTAGTV